MKRLVSCLLLGSGCVGSAGAEDLSLPPVDIHGFASQGYLKTSANNYLADTKVGTAEFNEFGVNFGARITNDLRVGIQILSRDLGSVGNDKPTIDWAFADYRHYDWLGFRAGIIKAPIGLYNESRDLDFARTSVLLPESVYSEEFRDLEEHYTGAGVYGNIAMPHAGSLDYHAFIGTTNVDADGGFASLIENSAPPGTTLEVEDIHFKYLYGAQVIWNTPLTGLRIGGTSAIVDYVTTMMATVPIPNPPPFNTLTIEEQATTKLWIRVASAEYIWKDLIVASEYIDVDGQTAVNLAGVPVSETSYHGYYLSAAYRFMPKFEMGTYYSVTRLNHQDQGDAKNYLKDLAVSARFDINNYWLIKLEGHHYNGVDSLLTKLNTNASGLPQLERSWWMFAAKTTVSF